MFKVKVCGMREAGNIEALSRLPIDYMGFIFYSRSPRYCGDADAKAILEALNGSDIQRVGVFVNSNTDYILQWIQRFALHCIQLHGTESVAFIRNLHSLLPKGTKMFKALSIATEEDIEKYKEYEEYVDMFLFDTKCKDFGGSGRQFNWQLLSHYEGKKPFLLSGGIGPGDAEHVLQFTHPRCIGVDLNSKFELKPGIKDIEKLKAFIRSLRS